MRGSSGARAENALFMPLSALHCFKATSNILAAPRPEASAVILKTVMFPERIELAARSPRSGHARN